MEDTDDFDEAFDRLFPRAERLAFRILGSWAAAEDVAAEAMARAYAGWKKVGRLPHRDGWVLRVATNVAIDVYRRRRPAPDPVESIDPEEAATTRVALAAALACLPRRQRAVIALRHLEGLSEPEVADVLGLSLGTVKTHARRGAEALRRQLGDAFQEVSVGTD